MTADPILDNLFHACAFAAFMELSFLHGGWPDSKAVKERAYQLYEEELARKNETPR